MDKNIRLNKEITQDIVKIAQKLIQTHTIWNKLAEYSQGIICFELKTLNEVQINIFSLLR